MIAQVRCRCGREGRFDISEDVRAAVTRALTAQAWAVAVSRALAAADIEEARRSGACDEQTYIAMRLGATLVTARIATLRAPADLATELLK